MPPPQKMSHQVQGSRKERGPGNQGDQGDQGDRAMGNHPMPSAAVRPWLQALRPNAIFFRLSHRRRTSSNGAYGPSTWRAAGIRARQGGTIVLRRGNTGGLRRRVPRLQRPACVRGRRFDAGLLPLLRPGAELQVGSRAGAGAGSGPMRRSHSGGRAGRARRAARSRGSVASTYRRTGARCDKADRGRAGGQVLGAPRLPDVARWCAVSGSGWSVCEGKTCAGRCARGVPAE